MQFVFIVESVILSAVLEKATKKDYLRETRRCYFVFFKKSKKGKRQETNSACDDWALTWLIRSWQGPLINLLHLASSYHYLETRQTLFPYFDRDKSFHLHYKNGVDCCCLLDSHPPLKFLRCLASHPLRDKSGLTSNYFLFLALLRIWKIHFLLVRKELCKVQSALPNSQLYISYCIVLSCTVPYNIVSYYIIQ